MVALGEMISHLPIAGGQFALAGRFVSPAVGFGMGWLYWYNYIVVLPAELSASAVLVSYWTPVFSVLINAAFAFIGTEITAITAAECANPKRAVPTAIKSVWIRLVLFYLCSAFIIGLLVSPSDPDLNLGTGAAKSPFVLAMKNAGISVLPSVVNAALLTSAWSAGCADLFVSSRALYGLASRGQAPAIFRKVRKDGLPWVCVLCGSAFALISFMAGASGKAGTVFGYCVFIPN